MPLTFASAKIRIGTGILRDDLVQYYGDYINEAIQEIENRRDWLCMKATVNPVTIPGSLTESSVALPANFKSLQKRTPVYLVNSDGSFIPAHVWSEAQQIHRQTEYSPRIYGYTSAGINVGGCDSWPPKVFVNIGPNGAVLGTVQPLQQDLNFRVDYYGYLPDLVGDNDTSPFLTKYPKMTLAKAKAIAFTEINDTIAEAFESEFEKKLSEAVRAEAHAEVAGRETRM